MINRKQRKEIDKAVKNLINYVEQQAKWKMRLEEAFHEMLLPAAEHLGIDEDTLIHSSHEDGYWNMIFGYVFEDFASANWDNEDHSFIDEYIKRRGWREGAFGRRYLQSINDSQIKLWEIVAIKPGFHLDVRLFGSNDKPIRVIEKTATESLQLWDCLAGRVIKLNNIYLLTGAFLPLPPEEAERVLRVLESSKEQTVKFFQQLLEDEKIDALPADLEQDAEDNAYSELPEIFFRIWIVYLSGSMNQEVPTLKNKDGDLFQATKVRFSLNATSEKIIQALDAIPELDKSEGEQVWRWLPSRMDNLKQDEFMSVLGLLFLQDSSLILEVNSKERAATGSKWVSKKLGKLVEKPLTIHENINNVLETNFDNKNMIVDHNEDEQELMKAFMEQHYQQILDEPIPMLNDKTPRECAANKKLHKDVVKWLKYMENQSNKTPPPRYDFSWVWKELNLEKYKPN